MTRAARTARLSIVSNTCLIAMKLVIGFVTGSVSVLSEAIHSLMDLAAAFMAFFSIRMANRPADKDHPYGHGKIENVSGVLEAALIFVAACLIIYEAVIKIIHAEPIERLELGFGVMLASGIVNIIVSRILYKVAAEERSVALEADALHLKTDVYSSLGVAAGLLVIVVLQRLFHFPWASYLDPIVAMGIALFILKESWEMLRKAFGPLLDSSISPQEVAEIEKLVKAHPGVGLHSLRTRSSGGKKYIDFHLTVPETMSVKDSHDLCDHLEQDLKELFHEANILIHVEPGKTGRKNRSKSGAAR